MPLPQHITYSQGGTVSINRETLPSTATIRIIQGNGTVLVDTSNATISAINTTLNGAVGAGDQLIRVNDATGFSANDEFRVGGEPETCSIRSVSGTTINLKQPLLNDHASGETVNGVKVSYSVSASEATTLFWDGRVEWNIDGTIVEYSSVECTKYPLIRKANTQDLYDIEPNLYQLKEDSRDIESLLDNGLEQVLKRIAVAAPDLRVRVFTGSQGFITATCLASLMIFYMAQRGEESKELYERFRDELEAEISRIVAIIPRDSDQDGTVELEERMSYKSRALTRG